MKFTALFVTVAALAVGPSGWCETLRHKPAAAGEGAAVQQQAQEQQDEERYRVCDAQRAENPATRAIDFTADGRLCLITALDQAASVQGTLVLLRNASVALLKNSTDEELRVASLRAVGRARDRLISASPAQQDRFTEQATALDRAEFSIYLPKLHQQQQLWRLEAFWAMSKMAR